MVEPSVIIRVYAHNITIHAHDYIHAQVPANIIFSKITDRVVIKSVNLMMLKPYTFFI